MKRSKTVNVCFCDYCGEGCEHTPEYNVPSLEPIKLHGRTLNRLQVCEFIIGEEIKTTQKDICPKCQKKIASLLKLAPRVNFSSDDITSMEIIF